MKMNKLIMGIVTQKMHAQFDWIYANVVVVDLLR